MSKKQLRAFGGGLAIVAIGVGLKTLGFAGVELAGYFIGAGLIGGSLGLAYGLGTWSANMSPDVKSNAK